MPAKIRYINQDNTTRPFPDAFEVDGAEFKINGDYVCVEPCGGGSTIPSDNIDIYIDGTGDDVTGDGTQGNPYLTFSRAVVHVNSVVTANGDIRVIIPGKYNCDAEAGQEFNHPNKIILMALNSWDKFYFTADTECATALTIKNTNLEIRNCSFYFSDNNIVDVSGGNNTLSLIDCDGEIRKIVNSAGMNNKLYIYNTSLTLRTLSIIQNFTEVYVYNFNISQHSSYNGVLLYFISCTISNMTIILDDYQNEGQHESVIKFFYCDILTLEFSLNTLYARHHDITDGVLFFEHCVVNKLFVLLESYTESPISFYSTFVNYMFYLNNTYFESNQPLIYADKGSIIYVNLMSRQQGSNEHYGYLLDADNCSLIKVLRINNYGNLFSSNSIPNWRGPGETYIFDSGKDGSCIYVDYVYYSGGGG